MEPEVSLNSIITTAQQDLLNYLERRQIHGESGQPREKIVELSLGAMQSLSELECRKVVLSIIEDNLWDVWANRGDA